MTHHPDTPYWDRGASNVPDMTGARHLLDGRDLVAVFAALGLSVPLTGSVVDIGCGTGRLAQLCRDGYWGFDIAPAAVEYCRARGLTAQLITGPGFHVKRADLIACISVFTHMSRDERVAYLESFAAMPATDIVVDIIPGDGTGNVAVWTAVPAEFEADAKAAGFAIAAVTDHQWDDHRHRYYRLRRAV